MPEAETPLLTPHSLICDDHAWRYPTTNAAPGGYGRLRMWTTDEGPLLAVVSECGIGTSVMNAAEGIRRALVARLGSVPFVQFEHWPAEQRSGHETLDRVVVDQDDRASWEPMGTLEGHPDHAQRSKWMSEHGHRLMNEGGPWSLPDNLVEQLNAEIGRVDQENWDELFRLAGYPPEKR